MPINSLPNNAFSQGCNTSRVSLRPPDVARLYLTSGTRISPVLGRLLGSAPGGGAGTGGWVAFASPDTIRVGSLPISEHGPKYGTISVACGAEPSTWDERTRTWVAVDGFFTNRRSLAAELGMPGSVRDADLAAVAYGRWGIDFLRRLDGQWSLLLLDTRTGVALAARDALGIGQLYFAHVANELVLSSEPKAVAAALPGGLKPEPVRFGEFLNGFPPSTTDLTFFAGVRSVPAGGALRITLSPDGATTVRPFRHWHPGTLPGWEATAPPFEESARRFEQLLGDAVGNRVSGVPFGTLLSGGLDSSVLTAIATESIEGDARLPSFSILHSDPSLTEERWIEAVVARLGIESHRRTIEPQDAWDAVDAVVSVQGEPLLGQDLIGQWLAYRLAADRGVRTLVDGIGADELLGGSGTEHRIVLELLRRGRALEFAREVRALSDRHGLGWYRTVRRYAAGPLRRDLTLRRGRRRYRWIARSLAPDPFADAASADASPDRSALSRYLYRHVRHENAPTVLARLDRSAAALGVRPLVPFLDRSVVEWCLPMPDRYKVFRGQPKRLLHAVARRRLPAEVADRTDKKAIVTGSAWMPLRTSYAQTIREAIADRHLRDSGWIDVREMARFVDGYFSGRHDDHLAVWRLFTASRWLDLFDLV